MGQPGGTLTSFREGMSQLIGALANRYQDVIQINRNIRTIHYDKKCYVIEDEKEVSRADHLFLCTPSYVAGSLLEDINPSLANQLQSIYYAPISVVGLCYSQGSFERKPEGFGYLIPSSVLK